MEGDRKNFLGHIAGLRGLAIMLVVLFHLNSRVWPHGYLGVDVFLVITGYLLFRGQGKLWGWRDAGRFLARRAQRIVPAMAVVIVLVVLVGMAMMEPADELFLCREGHNACLAKLNRLLSHDFGNYFASDSVFNPLLHLWYLSVILQVYVLWGAAKLVQRVLPKRWGLPLLVVVGVASLVMHTSYALHEALSALGLPVWSQKGEVSYYATLPRLWEVLAGGVVVLLPELRRHAGVAVAVGACLVLGPALVGTLPGTEWAAQLPLTLSVVAGTVLLLRYSPACRADAVLNNKLLRGLGAISFSVYLVHMPIIVYGRMWVYGNPDMWDMGCMVLASLVVGWVFWLAVEKRRMAWWGVLLLWVATFMLCRTGRKSDGFRTYIPSISAAPVKVGYSDWQPCTDDRLMADLDPAFTPYDGVFGYILCLPQAQPPERPLMAMGDASRPASVVLIGDSHATHLYAGFDVFCRREGITGVYFMPIVMPFLHWEINRRAGYEYNLYKEAALLRWLAAHREITHVVISQHWQWRTVSPRTCSVEKMEQDLRAFLQTLQAMGKQVVLMGSSPAYPAGVPTRFHRVLALRRMSMSDVPTIVCTQEQYRDQVAQVMPMLRRMESEGLCCLVDPLQALQAGESFVSVVGNDCLIVDKTHLSPAGSKWYVERLAPQLRRALGLPAAGSAVPEDR